jgi:anti-sigma factor ChrR (cupin superfamily)
MMNEEDVVRNLMHAHGFYVDRRMWMDVVDLHIEDTTVRVSNEIALTGKAGVRQLLDRMEPEGLTQGINNDHPIFDMIMEVAGNGKEAIARGIEAAMLSDANLGVAS